MTLLLSSEGEARAPALSPDGKIIAYIASEAGSVNLYVSRVAGGQHIGLTDDSAFEKSRSVVLPRRERIAFARQRPDLRGLRSA